MQSITSSATCAHTQQQVMKTGTSAQHNALSGACFGPSNIAVGKGLGLHAHFLTRFVSSNFVDSL